MQKALIIIVFVTTLLCGGCAANNAQTGAGLGSLGGALVGALTSKDKVIGAAFGAAGGALAGYVLGNEIDKYEAKQIGHTAESLPSGKTKRWINPDTGKRYAATPKPAVVRKGKIQRDVVLRAESGERIHVTVERERAGKWRIVK